MTAPGRSIGDSKIQASLKDGTLTVIVHPSDSNVSNNLYDYLEPLLLAE